MAVTRTLRRCIALLHIHFVRNVAYHKASFRTSDGRGQLHDQSEYGITVSGNFLDIAILEWCKVFGDWNGKHHWRTLTPESSARAALFGLMLSHLRMRDDDWRKYVAVCNTYRDKFVAHLDENEVGYTPDWNVALQSAFFMYGWLIANSPEGTFSNVIGGSLPIDLPAYYRACFEEAVEHYSSFMPDSPPAHPELSPRPLNR